MEDIAQINRNPVALINMLYRYSRKDYGSVFLYLPTPKREVDQEAWAWLDFLKSTRATRKRWVISADHALVTLGETHAHLFSPPPVCFETYRLDQRTLNRIFARL